MNIYRIYKILLHVGIAISLIGFNFRIMHWPGGGLLWNLSYVLTLAYVALGIYLVLKDETKGATEKGAWSIGLFLIPPIIGLIYYYTEIKKRNAST